ncbi:MAG: hypothetical protein K2J32_04135 [Ruminococcus sp.]|nr:hypothetical protein [Ruminococcus sp.]
MKYILYTYQGFKNELNDICFTFDMSKSEVHDLMGKEPDYIMSTLEYYDDFRIDYDDDDRAVAFEFFSWANIVIENDDFPDLKEINLFSLSNKRLNRLIKKHDFSAETDASGIISLKYGIGTYCESSNRNESEAIIIFKKGYYDS